MAKVRCRNCHTEYPAPSGPLDRYMCARCGHSLEPLPAPSPVNKDDVVGAGVGAAIGFALAGPPGAVIGGFLGLLVSRN